jgi:hypothetical protein
MSDLKDGPASALSAIRDVLMQNQNLKQQDLEARYGHYGQKPEQPEPSVDTTSEVESDDVEQSDEPSDQE